MLYRKAVNKHTIKDYYIKCHCLCLLSTVDLPISKVTPEGLIFIAQWHLKVIFWYCLISHAFQLIGWLLIRLLRLMLKLLRVMVTCLLPGWSGKLLAWRSKLKSWPKLKGEIKLNKKEEQPKKLIERLKSPSLSLPKSWIEGRNIRPL